MLIGEILVVRGACPADGVAEGLDDQLACGGRLGTNLLEAGIVSEEQLARALSAQHGLPARWGDVAVEASALALLAPPLARRWEAVPLRLERRRLDVLVCEVRDLARIDEMAFATGKEIRPVVVPELRLRELLRRHYGVPLPERPVRAGRRGSGRVALPLAARQEGAQAARTGAAPAFGGVLATNQEQLADLQRAAGPVGRAGVGAPSAAAPEAFLSDAEILADLQGDAARRFGAAGVPLSRPAVRWGPAESAVARQGRTGRG